MLTHFLGLVIMKLMAKKTWIFIFLAILFVGFIVGYVTMAFDIKNGILGQKDSRTIWQILSPL